MPPKMCENGRAEINNRTTEKVYCVGKWEYRTLRKKWKKAKYKV